MNLSVIKKHLKKIYIKEVLILLYSTLFYKEYYERIIHFGFTLKSFIFISLLLLCVFSLYITSYIRNNYIRIFFGLAFFLSTILFVAYNDITSTFLTYDSYITLVGSVGFASEAIDEYMLTIVPAIFFGLLILIGIIIKPNISKRISKKIYMIIPVFVLFLLISLIFIRGGEKSPKGLPPSYNLLAYSALELYESSKGIVGERKDVQIERSKVKVEYDIILIVDESIAPRYLDFISEKGVLTNLNYSYKNIDVFNYGYAASIANCSASSNLSLRFGGKRENYLMVSSTMPSIWQYAKKAELETVYIDAQRTGGALQNYMTDDELKYIDHFIQFDSIPVINRDMSVASELVKLIKNGKREFIYVNKVGAHFPVQDKFPNDFIKYKPILQRGNYLNISDTGHKENFSGDRKTWSLYRNSYRNTILWNVGEFFKKVISETEVKNAVIIYTSDHGQDLHEAGNPGLGTHCSSDPLMVEGRVPLVIIQNSSVGSLNWQKNIHQNFCQASHYNIFPTLLSLMYYDDNKIIPKIYGNSLEMETNDDLTFNINYNARLGTKPVWKKINVKKYRDSIEHLKSNILLGR